MPAPMAAPAVPAAARSSAPDSASPSAPAPSPWAFPPEPSPLPEPPVSSADDFASFEEPAPPLWAPGTVEDEPNPLSALRIGEPPPVPPDPSLRLAPRGRVVAALLERDLVHGARGAAGRRVVGDVRLGLGRRRHEADGQHEDRYQLEAISHVGTMVGIGQVRTLKDGARTAPGDAQGILSSPPGRQAAAAAPTLVAIALLLVSAWSDGAFALRSWGPLAVFALVALAAGRLNGVRGGRSSPSAPCSRSRAGRCSPSCGPTRRATPRRAPGARSCTPRWSRCRSSRCPRAAGRCARQRSSPPASRSSSI